MSTLEADGRAGGLVGLYRALWRHAAEDRGLVVLFMMLLVAAQFVQLSIPYFTAQAINAIQADGFGGFAEAGRNLALTFAASVVLWMLHGPGRVVESIVALRLRERIADALLGKALSLPMRWHEKRHSGDTIARVSRATGALHGFSQSQFMYLQNAINLLGPIGALTLLCWQAGALSIVGYGLIALVLFRFDNVMMRLGREENAASNRYHASLVDALGNVSTVLALRLQAAARKAVAGRLAAVSAPARKAIVVNEAKWCAIDIMTQALTYGVVALYGWLAWRDGGALMLGSAVMVLQYAQRAGGVIHTLASQWQGIRRTGIDFADGAAILEEPSSVQGASMLPIDWREIRVDGLNFGYAEKRAERPALADISLTLKRGQRVALVGESGSGKSTLLRVLAGLYEPDSARFNVDGAALPGLRHLGAAATLIPQDPEVFEASLAYNLSLGREDDPASVRRACDVARFTPVLETLPRGLETVVSERGVNLSGGQMQRLALARGVLAAQASSIVLLDEPTSSIDPVTEGLIYENLFETFRDACIVSSIHRLHLLPRFDLVVLMAQGRIVDSGPLADVLARQPALRAMCEGASQRPAPEPIGAEPLAA